MVGIRLFFGGEGQTILLFLFFYQNFCPPKILLEKIADELEILWDTNVIYVPFLLSWHFLHCSFTGQLFEAYPDSWLWKAVTRTAWVLYSIVFAVACLVVFADIIQSPMWLSYISPCTLLLPSRPGWIVLGILHPSLLNCRPSPALKYLGSPKSCEMSFILTVHDVFWKPNYPLIIGLHFSRLHLIFSKRFGFCRVSVMSSCLSHHYLILICRLSGNNVAQ